MGGSGAVAHAACLDTVRDNGTIYNLTQWVLSCDNATNNSLQTNPYLHGDGSGSGTSDVEHIVSIVVAICFGLIGLAGLFGNSLVILGGFPFWVFSGCPRITKTYFPYFQ